MRPWRYCPACGARLTAPEADGGARCPGCGATWYRNPSPTVGAALVRSGRALVTVRARPPEQGRVDVPGGFLDPGEDPLDGLRREVREEVGLDIDVAPEDFVQAIPHRYGDDGDWLLALGFVARAAAGDVRPADDVAEAHWVTEADLDGLDFAWGHDRALVRAGLRRAQG